MVAFLIFDPLVVLIDMILCAVPVVVVYPAQMTARQLGSKAFPSAIMKYRSPFSLIRKRNTTGA